MVRISANSGKPNRCTEETQFSGQNESWMGIFSGIIFAFNSKEDTLSNDLVNLITDNGGEYARSVTSNVTHLVATSLNPSMRIDLATKHHTHIIRPEFFEESAERGLRLNEAHYWLKKSEQKSRGGKKEAPIAKEIKKSESVEGKSDAQKEYRVQLFLKTEEEEKELEVKEGSNTFGRGDDTGISDKRCSRNQVEIIVDKKKRKVTAIQRGTNPSMIRRAHEDNSEHMKRDEEYKIDDGDTITLVTTLFPIVVRISSADLKRRPESPLQKTSKRAKKEQDLPPCPYGSKCYRKSKEHNQQFSHSLEEEHSEEEQKETAINDRGGDDEMGEKEEEGHKRIAFPSISTSNYGFDIDRAAKAAVRVITDFLETYNDPDLRLVLVDIQESDTLSAFRKHYTLKDKRFVVQACDITKMKSVAKLRCRYIVNAANPGYSSGGHGANRAIHAACESRDPQGKLIEHLFVATKKRAKSGSAGDALLVELPLETPMRKKEGVEFVIHCVGPNMNDNKPNSLRGDYVKGTRLLTKCYASILSHFALSLGLKPKPEGPFKSDYEDPFISDIDDDELDSLMNPKKEKIEKKEEREEKKEEKKPNNAFSLLMGNTNKFDQQPAKKPASGSNNDNQAFKNFLLPYVTNSDANKESIYLQTNDFTVIKDKYPKARYHFLVMSHRKPLIMNLKDLDASKVDLLEQMKSVGEDVVQRIQAQNPDVEFKIGFHAQPSLNLVHMHVISQDFDSPCIKNKKHWNSFTTPFFVQADQFIEMLERDKKIQVGVWIHTLVADREQFDEEKYKKYLEAPLKYLGSVFHCPFEEDPSNISLGNNTPTPAPLWGSTGLSGSSSRNREQGDSWKFAFILFGISLGLAVASFFGSSNWDAVQAIWDSVKELAIVYLLWRSQVHRAPQEGPIAAPSNQIADVSVPLIQQIQDQAS
ncbi:putative aprataxin [Planoprotostelium fungivorum]|uniref:Putative aprataxin n=1 Tax=Planoprotostelium fungivorum TaxID=1890364 RepID=A0A2P6NV99_9EUKA|nr:putative aprataxin [Planoprotostelium fungivorum]